MSARVTCVALATIQLCDHGKIVLDFSEPVSSPLISRECVAILPHQTSSVPFLPLLARGYPWEGNCTENILVLLSPFCRGGLLPFEGHM